MKNTDNIISNTNENITKFDGILSLLLIIFFNNTVLILKKNTKDNMFYIFASILCVSIIFIIIKRKQSFLSIGINEDKKPYLIIGIIFLIVVIYYIYTKKPKKIWTFLLYLLPVAIFEDICYLSYLQPRLNNIIKNEKTTLILGALIFAGSHVSSEYSLRGTFQLSKYLVVRNYNLFVIYIFYFLTYKKTKNILYVSIIHCLWDFLPEL